MGQFTQRIAMKAVITNQAGEILLVRIADTDKAAGKAGSFTLPGGKVKAGEQWDEALLREIHEETGLKIIIGRPLQVGEWRPVVRNTPLQIIGVFFECKTSNLDVKLSAEHDGYEWVDLIKLETLNILEPDRSIARQYLEKK